MLSWLTINVSPPHLVQHEDGLLAEVEGGDVGVEVEPDQSEVIIWSRDLVLTNHSSPAHRVQAPVVLRDVQPEVLHHLVQKYLVDEKNIW